MGLVISNKQLSAIQEQINNTNIDEYISFLREQYPEKYSETPYKELCALIQKGINHAAKYKISKVENIKTFISHCIAYPIDISRYPSLEQVLKNYSISEANRVEIFYLSLLSGRYKLISISKLSNFKS